MAEPAGDSIEDARKFLAVCSETNTLPAERAEALEAARSAFSDARRAEVALPEQVDIFQQLVAFASRDPDPFVRTVAPAVVEDVCVRSLPFFARDATEMLGNSLGDPDPLVRMRAVRAATTIFRRTMGLAFANGIDRPSTGEESGADRNQSSDRFSTDWFESVVSLHLTVLKFITDPHDGLANAAVKFADPLILALSYTGTGVSGSQDHFTLDFAYANATGSPGADVSALQAHGKAAVVTLGEYIRRALTDESGSGIRSMPFMTALMVLGNIARRRKLLIDLVIPPLVEAAEALVKVESTSEAVVRMTEGERASAVMVLRLSLQSLRSYSHVRIGPIVATLAKMCEQLSAYEAREYSKTLRKRDEEKVDVGSVLIAPNDHARESTQYQCLDRPTYQPGAPGSPEEGCSARLPSSEDLSGRPRISHPTLKRQRALPPHALGREADRITPELASQRAGILIRASPPDKLVDFILRKLLDGPGDLKGGETSKKRPRGMDSSNGLARTVAGSADEEGPGKGFGCIEATGAVPSGNQRVVPRRISVPIISYRKPSSEERNRLLELQCRRIMESEQRALASGAGPLRILSLARLLASSTAAMVEGVSVFAEEVIDFIVRDLESRIELALAWLHAEAANCFVVGGTSAHLPEIKDEEIAPMSIVSPPQLSSTENGRAGGCLKLDSMHGGFESNHVAGESEADVKTAISKEVTIASSNVVAEGQCAGGKLRGEQCFGKSPITAGSEKIVDTCGETQIPVSCAGTDSRDLPTTLEGRADCSFDNGNPCAPARSGVTEGKPPKDDRQIDVQLGAMDSAPSYEAPSEAGKVEEIEAGITFGMGPVQGGFEVGARYEALLVAMLRAAARSLGPEDRTFSRLVVEAPVIPKVALDQVVADCRDAARSRLGLSTLRDVICERSGHDRERCLDILLQFTTDGDAILRGPAIRLVVGKLFEEMTGEVPEAVEQFAVKSLDDAIVGALGMRISPEPQSAGSEKESEEHANTLSDAKDASLLERRIWLLTALCAKKPSLLKHFALAFVKAPRAEWRATILGCAKEIARQLGPESDALLDLVRGEGAPYSEMGNEVDELVLGLASASMKKAALAPDCLVEAARVRYERSHDARLLYLVLTGLSREHVVHYLPELMNVRSAETEISFKDVLFKIMSARPQVIEPSDMLVELHMLPCTPVVCSALKACFELKSVFRREVVASALQKLLERETIPDMMMRTILLARLLYPRLERFIRDTVVMGVQGIIRKRVWKYPILWKGFVQYCCELRDRSLAFIVRLPPQQLQELVSTQGDLRRIVQLVLADEGIRINRRDRRYLSSVLKEGDG